MIYCRGNFSNLRNLVAVLQRYEEARACFLIWSYPCCCKRKNYWSARFLFK